MSAIVALLTLVGCSSVPHHLGDNSLEATGIVSPVRSRRAEGLATVTPAEEPGDWDLEIGGTSFRWHSSSRADLSVLDGKELRLEIDPPRDGVSGARIYEGDEPILVASVGDGSEVFGRKVWYLCDGLGYGKVVNELGEKAEMAFYQVSLESDDGKVLLMPGEPTAVWIDGQSWRATVIAAYGLDPLRPHDRKACRTAELLSVELLRTPDAVDEDPLPPVEGRIAPVADCD